MTTASGDPSRAQPVDALVDQPSTSADLLPVPVRPVPIDRPPAGVLAQVRRTDVVARLRELAGQPAVVATATLVGGWTARAVASAVRRRLQPDAGPANPPPAQLVDRTVVVTRTLVVRQTEIWVRRRP